ncbi:MAG: transcriptional regulator [Candidatus Saccharibacteria bacterium]|nr:transcriptional regulator [Candidatus Saccharibacteria bacterium]
MHLCMSRYMVKKYGYSDNKDAILKRLNRAEGQVRGVSRMVEDDKYCIDILTQITATRAALDKVAVELIRDHAKHCMVHADSDEEKVAKADELVAAIGRMI